MTRPPPPAAPSPICDYCDRAAGYYARDSATEEPICRACARDQYGVGWRGEVGRVGAMWRYRQHLMGRPVIAAKPTSVDGHAQP